MDLDTRLRNVAVIGAAGKMGSGISLLLAQEMAFGALEHPEATYVLNLVDINDAALQGLLRYLKDQSRKTAEKQINRLRKLFAPREDLVENGEMVDAFVDEVLLHVRTGRTFDLAKDALLVFEAAIEQEDLKIRIYRELKAICPPEAFFLTNTSSIPLHVIADAAGIEGRIIGYHFYNPPAVQKLVELITPAVCDEELKALCPDLAKRLGKKIVPANDVAGFVGNGHFTRDGLHAGAEVARLAPEFGLAGAVYLVDKVSRDYLLRPMGIFQLIDYVGLDVFQAILRVMDQYMPGQNLHSDLVDRFMAAGIRGGQTSSGAQKDGIFQYDKGRLVAVYDLDQGQYVPFGDWSKALDGRLGAHPAPDLSWKGLQRDPAKEAKLRAYFANWKGASMMGVDLAERFFLASRAAGEHLVATGVASSAADVNNIMMLGFFHLYGPINDYV